MHILVLKVNQYYTVIKIALLGWGQNRMPQLWAKSTYPCRGEGKHFKWCWGCGTRRRLFLVTSWSIPSKINCYKLWSIQNMNYLYTVCKGNWPEIFECLTIILCKGQVIIYRHFANMVFDTFCDPSPPLPHTQLGQCGILWAFTCMQTNMHTYQSFCMLYHRGILLLKVLRRLFYHLGGVTFCHSVPWVRYPPLGR